MISLHPSRRFWAASLLLTAFWILLISEVPAQTYSVIHNFASGTPANDGEYPCITLITGLDGNYYGLTSDGGSANRGTMFRMTPTGSVTILHSFADGSVDNDGFNPASLMQCSDGTFYGTTTQGGTYYPSSGSIFKISPQGTYSIVHAFQDGSVPADGSGPDTISQGTDGNFYGTTQFGGTSGNNGTFFRMTPQGALTILYNFESQQPNDGSAPRGPIVEGGDGNFYGTTFLGTGAEQNGMVYSMSPQGLRTVVQPFTNLARPMGLVAASDGNMYGMANISGTYGWGGLFRFSGLSTVTTLYNFGANSTLDGAYPAGCPVLASDGNLYGATAETSSGNGAGGTGLVFKLTPQGQMTVLHQFTVGYAEDGNQPATGIVQGPNGNLCGTTSYGGTGNGGTVYQEALGLHALAPVITGLMGRHGIEAMTFAPYYIIASGSPASYNAANLPPGLTINTTTGIIAGVPTLAGIYRTTISATNGGGTSSAILTITIDRAADTPTLPNFGLAILAALLIVAAMFRPQVHSERFIVP